MPTETPDLVSEYEDQKQSAPDLVSEFEQQKTAPQRPDFTQEALSGKLAPVAGKPHDPQLDQPIQYNAKTGQPYQEPLVPEAEGWKDPLLHIAAGAEPIATGLSRIKENSAPPVSPQMPAARSSRGGPAVLPQAPHTPEQAQRDRQTMLGGAEVMEGASQLGTIALPAALAGAPLKVGAGLVAGTLASEGAGKAVHGKVSPEAERAIRAASFVIPSAAGMMAGLKFSGAETPGGEAKFSGVEAFDGKAKAAYVRTPESIRAGAKIGDTQFEVNIPRNGAQAPVATPPPVIDEATAAMVRYEQNAGNIPKPSPPVQPPTPSQKAGMDNKLSGDQVEFIAHVISKAPPEQQNALIEEAHKNISQWLTDNNGRVFVDGKVVLAKNPDQVSAVAAKIINDASSAHDKAQDLAAKEAEKAAKETEKQTTAKTARPSAPAPAPKPAAAPAKVDVQPKSEAPQGQPAAEKPVVQKVEENATSQNLTSNDVKKSEAPPERRVWQDGLTEEFKGFDKDGLGVWEPTTQNLPEKEATSQIAKNEVPDLVAQHEAAQHEATPDLVAEHEAQPERRTNLDQRKKVADMSPEERAKALLTSDTVDLPNKRAFTEAEHAGKSPAVAMSDADGLKALNDKFGYDAGNALLKAKAEALKEAGLDSYHDKGDEFLHRGESPEDLKTKLSKARDILKNRVISVEKSDGTVLKFKGANFSYGTGKDLDTAEAGLKAHKSQREAAGERKRGELRGIVEAGSEASQEDHGRTAEVKLLEGIPAKGHAARVPVKSLTLAPKEFQYKLNTNEHGVTNLLSGQKWNDDLAGVVSIWHNPANGKAYVVNGHHRVQLAKQNGQKDLLARHLNVDTASEARAAGALQNIAEGRGTPVDAAKFFRERGITPADLEKHGVSMGEATAENGLALSKLDPYLFDKVVNGELSQGRGIAIGKATDNPATQEAVLKLIEKAEKRGRRITDGQVSELARFAGRAKETTTEEGGLFGKSFRTENNALDKAEVSDYIKQKLMQEKRVFGAVSSEGKAEVLGQVKGQNIKAGANQKIALEAAQAGELYDKLSASRGPIDDILETAAQRLAKRENPATVKADAYKQARTELRKTLSRVEGQGTDGNQKDSDRRNGHTEADRQASVKQTEALEPLRRRKPSAEEPALPGMAPHIEASKESAAATQGEDLSKRLTETKSISGKTGEMERSSPLFRDSEASGQTGLFGDRSVKGKESERGFAAADIPEVLTRGVVEPVASFVKDTIKQTAESRSVDDKLFGLSKQYEADVLRAIELMKQAGPLSTPEDQAAIYHHLEDSSVPLDSKQQSVLDKIVKPLMQQSSAIRSELNNAGVPMGEEGYVHRVVQGKSSQLERAMRGKQGTGKGNVLSKSAASLKQRKMFALEDEDGNRQVVSMEGGRITGFKNGAPEDMGASPRLKVGDNFNDKTGKPWTLQQATTKEIESATNLKYYKNALASAVTDYLQLLRAKRANDALESMKSDPGFNQMAFKSEKGSMPPDGWRSVDLPQFRDYYFEPHMAEVLNRFAKELHPDPVTFLEKVGNFMTASLLLNPIPHIRNIANHALIERGVSGTVKLPTPTTIKAGVKAIKAVATQNKDFLSALDHGAPMMSHRTDLQQLNQKLFETIVGHLEKNPGIAGEIARLTGWDKADSADTGVVNTLSRATGLRMLNNLRKMGQKAMWMSNDIFMLQAAYEKMARDPNMDFEQAMGLTEKHIPNYRIPTRIMNSKMLGDFMGSRLASMFGRYHYGRWKSYWEMGKEVAGPSSTPKERLRGLDHLIMLGLVTFVGYELSKAVLKKITGDRDAHMVPAGASTIPLEIKELMDGNKAPNDVMRDSFTPAVFPQTAAEIFFNRNFYSGAPVYKWHRHSLGSNAAEILKYAGNTLGPVQQYNRAQKSHHPAKSFLLSQVGVSTSHPKKHR
jgi:GGDEF domain-containing protein